MWNELNWILGVSRKDGLSKVEGAPDEAAPGPANEPESEPAAPVAPSSSELKPPEASRSGLPDNCGAKADDAMSTSQTDAAAWARQFADETIFDPDPIEEQSAETSSVESTGDLPPAGDGSAMESLEPHPFGFALPYAGRRKPSGRRLVKPDPAIDKTPAYKPEQRLLILDC